MVSRIYNPLRIGSHQTRLEAVCLKFGEYKRKVIDQLTTQKYCAFISQQGLALSQVFQPVGLHYLSEKMGFLPPPLSEFERRLQACAFQQLLTFLDECEYPTNILDPIQMRNYLFELWDKDLKILKGEKQKEQIAFTVINELEQYFYVRFYANFPK